MRLIVCITHPESVNSARNLRLGKLCGVLGVTALLAAGVAGCGSIKPVKYYQLTHPATAVLPAAASSVDAAILVRLFQTSHLYREDRIVYGGESEQLGLYENHRWVEPPVELLQDALARGLRSTGHFRAVTTLRSDANSDFSLNGRLYAFREVSTGSVVARLNFDVELMDLKLGKVIWRHTYNHDEPASGKTVADLAAAMDKNVQLSVQEIHDGILPVLANYPRK
jgi:ABC-type uncharacterized transport system auxiliary subunit